MARTRSPKPKGPSRSPRTVKRRPDQSLTDAVPKGHLDLIAGVIIQWSRLDGVIQELIWKLLKLDIEDGRVVTCLNDISVNISILRTLLRRKLPKAIARLRNTSARPGRCNSEAHHRLIDRTDFLDIERAVGQPLAVREGCVGSLVGVPTGIAICPAQSVGECGLARKMRQGRRQPWFDPNNRLLHAGGPCFEAVDAGFTHEPSTDQRLHKNSVGPQQSGSGDHRGDDELPAVAVQMPRFGFEFALLGRVFGGLGNRAVYPHDLPLQVRLCAVRHCPHTGGATRLAMRTIGSGMVDMRPSTQVRIGSPVLSPRPIRLDTILPFLAHDTDVVKPRADEQTFKPCRVTERDR